MLVRERWYRQAHPRHVYGPHVTLKARSGQQQVTAIIQSFDTSDPSSSLSISGLSLFTWRSARFSSWAKYPGEIHIMAELPQHPDRGARKILVREKEGQWLGPLVLTDDTAKQPIVAFRSCERAFSSHQEVTLTHTRFCSREKAFSPQQSIRGSEMRPWAARRFESSWLVSSFRQREVKIDAPFRDDIVEWENEKQLRRLTPATTAKGVVSTRNGSVHAARTRSVVAVDSASALA